MLILYSSLHSLSTAAEKYLFPRAKEAIPRRILQKEKRTPSEKDEKEGVLLHFAPKKYRNTKPVQACCFLFYVIE